MRVTIASGIYYGGYEPHDLPGAYIVTRHAVKDAQGLVPPGEIDWQGPGEWIESKDGVPAGYTALWLGTRQATRPMVVLVRDEPTPESGRYERAYRRGYKASRRPVVPATATGDEVEGLIEGWKASPRNRAPGQWRRVNLSAARRR